MNQLLALKNKTWGVSLIPLADIHLTPQVGYEAETKGNRSSMIALIFAAIEDVGISLVFVPIFLHIFRQRFIRNQKTIMYMRVGRHFFHHSGHFTRYLIVCAGKDEYLPDRVFVLEIFTGNRR